MSCIETPRRIQELRPTVGRRPGMPSQEPACRCGLHAMNSKRCRVRLKILHFVAHSLGVLIHINGLPYGRYGRTEKSERSEKCDRT
jgi:hypothetical protein